MPFVESGCALEVPRAEGHEQCWGGAQPPLGLPWTRISCIFSHHTLCYAPQGVIEFSLCLLFAKLVSYTFLYWLPLYIFNVGKCQEGRKR